MVAVWPDTLSTDFMRDGFSYRQDDNRVKFEPQAGPPKRRRRSTARTYMIGGSLFLTSVQVDVLQSFFENDIADGTLPFELEDPLTGDTVRMTFESMIAYTPTGAFHNALACWRATFELRRMP